MTVGTVTLVTVLWVGLPAQTAEPGEQPVAEAPEQAEALVGKIRVTGPAISRKVNVVVDGTPVALSGEIAAELGRLGSAQVEVLGTRQADAFAVRGYRILDVGGGVQPLVGELVKMGEGLALRDGDGEPIALSAAPRARARLEKKLGAKIWVSGKKLVSGELKVTRYGILKDPPKK